MPKTRAMCCRTIRSSIGCGRPASTSHAAPWRNIAKPCGYPRPCSAAAKSRRPPAPPIEIAQNQLPFVALTPAQAAPSSYAGPGEQQRRQIMPFRVSGKNLDIGEALRERVSARVVEALSKYFNGGYSGHVTVGKE